MLQLDAPFSGKSILITGTTGFVGKAILEKLLREFSDIKCIYLLMRASKDSTTAEARFWDEIYTSSIFDSLKKDDEASFKGLCQEKCRFVTGEMTETQFGLSRQAYLDLANSIDLVINSAASVNFREPIDDALAINTLCLLSLVDFLEQAGDIPVVHISTCYVNGFHKGQMAEVNVAPQGKDIPKDKDGDYDIAPLIDKLLNKALVIKSRSSSEEESHEKRVDYGIRVANQYGWNDTYTFTKWLGEQLLRKYLKNKRLTIVRPAIVESALASPVPGWIEGVKVADALILAYARRRFSFFPARLTGVVDIIPVDFVANSVVLAAAEILQAQPDQRIYQCCSGGQNPLTISQYMKYVINDLKENWRDYPKLTKGRAPDKKLKAVSRSAFLAAMKSMKSLIKARSMISKSDPAIEAQVKSIDVTLTLATIYSFYTNPSYVFKNDNLISLAERFSHNDMVRCPVDAHLIDWREYLSSVHLPGLEKYGMK